ncbi:SWIM zinc finger family protein [Mesobacillus zeae]|uniref:SWIM zinc finger family protein n=1 Tax=Mesobacillus zeae TaxID=1917180 RepID=A0A398B161_9BACI|nr:SWIM zinc finger family protein [Mesobacillus zeae]RID82638.1 SWIM zinc finger family protein [Mesobacillus zeae]
MALISEAIVQQLKSAAVKVAGLLRPEVEEDARIFQKGLMLYRQGLVHHQKLMANSIWATVQDVTPARIYISLEDPEDSSCTCPAQGFCRHRMAAFMHSYSQADSVSDWVEEWRKPAKEMNIASQLGLQRAKDLIKTGGTLAYDYDCWIDSFKNTFREIMNSYGKPTPYVISNLVQAYLRKVEASAPFKKEWKELYDLIGSIEAFHLLSELSEELGYSGETIERYYGYVFDSLTDKIELTAEEMSLLSLPFDFDPFIEKIAANTSRLVEHSGMFDFERIHLYRILWTSMLKKTVWRDAERERLEKFGEGKRLFAEEIALAHHYFLTKRDKETLEIVKRNGRPALPCLFYWLDELPRAREWSRMGSYADLLVQQIRVYLADTDDYYAGRVFVKHSVKAVSLYCRETGKLDLLERLMNQSLPYSFVEYESFLFEKGDYEKWSELYTYANFDALELPNDKIKIVQKENPAVLLPILHHATDMFISQKNRASYRQAVRLLKKLRTIYKKLKRVGEWEMFFEKLLTRTKRLRAFHEECARSKLIEVQED